MVIVVDAVGARRRIASRPDAAGDKRRVRAILLAKIETKGEARCVKRDFGIEEREIAWLGFWRSE